MNTNTLYQSVVIQSVVPIGSIVQHKSQTIERKAMSTYIPESQES